MAEEQAEKTSNQEPSVATPETVKEESPARKAGKYFLMVSLIAVQLVVAWILVDRYYEPVQSWIQEARAGDPVFFKMDQIVVNPANTHGQRYLMVEISLELENTEARERFLAQRYRIRHSIQEELTSRTVDQLVQSSERERMRTDMTSMINELVGPGAVRNLYYSKYVMQ